MNKTESPRHHVNVDYAQRLSLRTTSQTKKMHGPTKESLSSLLKSIARHAVYSYHSDLVVKASNKPSGHPQKLHTQQQHELAEEALNSAKFTQMLVKEFKLFS